MKTSITTWACALALGTALIQPNPGQAEGAQGKLVARIGEIRTETTNTRDQLQATMDSLNVLTKQKKGDLRPAFATYTDQVNKTHAAADWTSARSTSMFNAGKEYFDTWQTEVTSINNESLRKKAQKRLDSVRKSYDKVLVSLQQAALDFKPFLSDLDDIQKTLANDVTPGGVKAVRGTVDSANWNVKKVRRSVGAAIEELGKMEKSLSSQTS